MKLMARPFDSSSNGVAQSLFSVSLQRSLGRKVQTLDQHSGPEPEGTNDKGHILNGQEPRPI